MAQLTPNYPKTVEALLYLMELAGDRRLTQYDLVKGLFIADAEHLTQFGRPITFCNYVAMEHGPVPSEAYDLLKGRLNRNVTAADLPWQSAVRTGKIKEFSPVRPANKQKLSKSDLRMLDFGYGFVSSRDFASVRQHTHEHPAYIEAWNRRGEREQADMKLEILANNDPELAEELMFSSRYIV